MSLPIVSRSKFAATWQTIRWRDGLSTYPFMEINEGELETLLALIGTAQRHDVMIEFGVNEGRTARVILDHYNFKQYVGVDVLPDYQTLLPVQRSEVPSHPGRHVLGAPNFELIVRARGSFDLTPSDLPAADVVFIDGDHSWAGVLNDTALARRLVRPGGIIIWHDYHDLGNVDVSQVLDEFHKAGDDIVHVDGTWLAFQSV